jgi:NAD(P)-dependent dehydrogenase (short-subunit alcohol dehydrogenase family)
MKGKVVLVTGAGRGIGYTVAEAFGARGASVAVHYLSEDTEAVELCGRITAAGGKAHRVQADLSHDSERERIFAETLSRFGRLDVLVNNAALDPGPVQFLEVDNELYDRVIGVNLKGLYFCCQSAARIMIRQNEGGRIINISSVHARMTLTHRSVYAASKGAVDALTRQLALDLGPHDITINAIAPGFIEVERTIRARPHYNREETARKIPSARVGFPLDVANLALFLASEEASYLNGEVITLDGGLCARLAF